MGNITERARRIVNLDEYSSSGMPDFIGRSYLMPPEERQYVLRMPIKIEGSGFWIPERYSWIRPMFDKALEYQYSRIGVCHPYCYLTIRHGELTSQNDDEWHVDGFSVREPHYPEQNYIWSNITPTEYVENLSVDFPQDFEPTKYNVNKYLKNFVRECDVDQMVANCIYCIDPYILHRRPKNAACVRTFVRISFVPIKIDDVNNTQNECFPPQIYTRDGLAFRNSLLEY